MLELEINFQIRGTCINPFISGNIKGLVLSGLGAKGLRKRDGQIWAQLIGVYKMSFDTKIEVVLILISCFIIGMLFQIMALMEVCGFLLY